MAVVTAERLRAVLSEATPGGWDLRVERRHEEAWIEAGPLALHVALADGRRNSDYEANARLCALAPDAIALLADMGDRLRCEANAWMGCDPSGFCCESCKFRARLDALCGDER